MFISCEDVISLEVPSENPRLVIDASLNWFKSTVSNNQEIKLSLTAPYFETLTNPANQAEVIVSNTSGGDFIFLEDGNTGIYKNDTFIPELNSTYTLKITYQNELYIGTETLLPVAPIEYVEQNLEGGFSGEDTEIKAYYTDPIDEVNFYFFEFQSELDKFPSLVVYDDEFINGNRIFAFHSDEDLEIGNSIAIRSYGISEQFAEYMFILLQQNTDGGGGPFETQPATVRGNCINTTNPENYPLGYFRLSEADSLIYTVN